MIKKAIYLALLFWAIFFVTSLKHIAIFIYVYWSHGDFYWAEDALSDVLSFAIPRWRSSLTSVNAYLLQTVNYVEDFANSGGKSTACFGTSGTLAPSGGLLKKENQLIRFVEPSSIPVGVGNMFDSSTSKSLEMIWDNYRYLNGGNNESPSK